MTRPLVLTVGARGGLLSKIDLVLERSNLTVHHVPLGKAALKIVQSKRPRLLIVALPLLDMRLDVFLKSLAEKRPASNGPAMALLADEHLLPELEPNLDERHRFLSAHLAPEELQRGILELIGDTPRVAPRLMLRLEVQLGAGKLLRMCQTDNISESGMLVRCQEPIAIGSEVRLALSLPRSAEPVQAKAEVVRQTDPDRESVQGLGLRFLEFEGQGGKALSEYLKSHATETRK
jgi:Tfp pilus assembly protein PilZ